MGQAKRRGTFEERKEAAKDKPKPAPRTDYTAKLIHDMRRGGRK